MEKTLKVDDLVVINRKSKSLKTNDIIVFNSLENEKKIIKRIIGLPNDELKIINSKVYINNVLLKEKGNYLFEYEFYDSMNSIVRIKVLSNTEYINCKEKPNIFIRHVIADTIDIFNNNWTLDNFGKIWIPKKNQKIFITEQNCKLYKKIISEIENTDIDSTDLINKYYVFRQNYYFVMGDNRHHSRDSRYFGFVPEDSILGKMIYKF